MKRTIHTFDAQNAIAGRLATRISIVLQGKQKVGFSPEKDMGDSVRVINVKGLIFSGKKFENNIYYRHTGRPRGLKQESLSFLFKKNPCAFFRKVVYSMLPHNKLRSRMMRRFTLEA